MELNKLKRILAEGNPDRQLDNIIENLSEASKIPPIRQKSRAERSEAKTDEAEAKLTKARIEYKMSGGNPLALNKVRELEAELKQRRAQENIDGSFVDETRKKVNSNKIDPLTGAPIAESIKIPLSKQNLEPAVKAPDPESEDYDQDGELDKNKEEIIMEKEQKDLFERSMENIFKILKEDDEEMSEEEILVGNVPAVESPEVEEEQEEIEAEEPVLEPEVQANDADVALAQPSSEVSDEEADELLSQLEGESEGEAPEQPSEDVASVELDSEPVVMVDDNSIKVHIPLASSEKVSPELGEVEMEALQEALRTVYRLLSSEVLSESEEAQFPENTSAELKVEGDHLVVEIPVSKPKDEVMEDEAEELQEAVSVIAFLLKEELGDAAAEPVHSEEEPKEHTPEVENKDVIDGQHAEEIKPVVTEAELGDAAAKPVHSEEEPKEHTPSVENKDVIDGQHAEEIKEVVVEAEGASPSKSEEQQYKVEEEIAPSDSPEPVVKTEVKSGEVVVQDHDHADSEGQEVRDELLSEEEEIVKLPSEDVEATASFEGGNLRIEIPLKGEEELEVAEEDSESLKETVRLIYSVFKSKNLTEAEDVVLPEESEATITKEGDFLVVEIPMDSPKEELSMEDQVAIQEGINYLSFLFNEAKGSPVYKAGKAAAIAGTGALGAGAASAAGAEIIRNQWLTAANAVKNAMPPVASMGADAWNNLFQINLAKAGLAPTADAAVKIGLEGAAQTIGTAVGAGAEAVTGVLGAIGGLPAPVVAAGLGITGAAAAALLASPAGRKFIATKLKLGKTGKRFKELEAADKAEMSANIKVALDKQLDARKEFNTKKAEGLAKETEAKKGLTLGSKVLSKIPLLNKLGDVNVFGFKPFQNAELSQRIKDAKAKAISDISSKPITRGLIFDKNTGKVELDSKTYAKLTPAEQKKALQDQIVLDKQLNKDYAASVKSFENELSGVKGQNRIDMVKNTDEMNKKTQEAQKDIEAEKLLRKDKTYQDLLYKKAQLKEDFDVEEAFSLLENSDRTFEEKIEILAEAKVIHSLVLLSETIVESGFGLNEKGISLFLEKNGYKSSSEENKELSDAINSDEVKKKFESYYQAKRHLDIEEDEIKNDDMREGSMKAEDVKSVVVESEQLGSAAAEPVHSEEKPEEHTPELENKDVLPAEEHQQAEEVKEVVVESEEKKVELSDEDKKTKMVDASKEQLEKLIKATGSKQKPIVNPGVVKEEAEVEAAEEINSKELNHSGSDTIDSDGQLAHNEEESDKKEELEVKAEPEDVTTNEAVNYGSLKEAFLLENGYFEKDSFEKISADKKKSKLVEQISLLVARDVQDPLYEELIRTTATAKSLQEKLQAKYSAVAKKKAGQLLDSKKLK